MRHITVAMALLVGTLAGLVWKAIPAMAVDCTTNNSWPFYQWTRAANDVYGVRAPIQARVDGGLCGVPGGGDDPFNAAWIAIVQAPSIVQIGYEHDFGMNAGHWCRFWAIGTGQPTDYKCGVDSNDTYLYLKIVRYYDSITHVYRYEIDDCGTGGGYGSCTAQSSSTVAYSSPAGQTASEADYTCVIHIMGSSSDRQNFGTSSYPVQGMDSSSWTTRSWGAHWDNGHTNCKDTPYGTDQGTDGMRFWDTRNSG
jgi:hypothetical protein